MPNAAQCFMCGKPVDNPVSCPGCAAVNYCSTAHLKAHRQSGGHSPADCRRFAAHVTSAPDLNAHLLFPWHPTAAQPSACTLLQGLGVHRRGAWVRECHCRQGTAYGLDAPLLKDLWANNRTEAIITREDLAERLKEWWGVPGGADLLTTATTAGLAIVDWPSYCRLRPIDTSHPLPVLLDAPLTAFWAVQRLRVLAGGNLPSRLTIAIVGAEKEVDQWPVLLELGSLLPQTELHVELIGPEVPCWADGRSITVPPAAGAPCTVRLGFYQGTLEKVVAQRLGPAGRMPDVVVGLNAGLGAYPEWMLSLGALKRWWGRDAAPRVCLFTDYIAESVHIARRNLEMLMGPGGGGLAAMAAAAGDPAAAAAMAPDMRGSVRISEAEVNPFRKPRWVAQPSHRMPQCPNGFALWMEH